MITIHFPSGHAITGRTPDACLKKWRAVQWNKTNRLDWRDELAKRAYIWSGYVVNTKLPAGEFLKELEIAGLVEVTGLDTITPTTNGRS